MILDGGIYSALRTAGARFPGDDVASYSGIVAADPVTLVDARRDLPLPLVNPVLPQENQIMDASGAAASAVSGAAAAASGGAAVVQAAIQSHVAPTAFQYVFVLVALGLPLYAGWRILRRVK